MVSRAWLAAALGVVAVAGCEGDPHAVGFRIRFANGTTATSARAVLVEIREGGCTGRVIQVAALRRDAPMSGTRRLGPGEYGFAAEARDGTCNAIAAGCEPVTLPRDGDVTVTLMDMALGVRCPMGCDDGVCMDDLPPDAGPPDTGTMPDTGPPPGCEAEGTACTGAGGSGGTCHGGACCIGCWNGSACAGGTGETECGSAGADCASCAMGTSCVSRACIPDTGAPATDFALGTNRSILRLADGRLWAAGQNTQMNFGPRRSEPANVYASIDVTQRFASMAAGQFASCGVDLADQGLYCMGTNAFGSLGLGDPSTSRVEMTPRRVGTGRWKRVAGTSQHFCAIDEADALHCWGDNQFGNLGAGDAPPTRPAPVRVGTASWTHVSAGDKHTCGIQSDGSLWCWGLNSFGQIGNGDPGGPTVEVPAPVRVGTAIDWIAIAAQGSHSCGIRGAGRMGSVWCWGNGMNGRLGQGDKAMANESVPQQVGMRTDWEGISTGLFHTCGLAAGVVYCWGFGSNVGDGGDAADELSPVAVSVGTDWVGVASGWRHSCGIRSSSPQFWCWGIDQEGELGVGAPDVITTYLEPTEAMLRPAP